jgi:hypothetical protein
MILLSSTFLVKTTVIGIPVSSKQTDLGFVSPRTNATLNLTNNEIESFWELVNPYHQNVSEFGGSVRFANNNTHLYSLIITQTDSWADQDEDNSWLSIEFEPDASCMANSNDGWSFYLDEGTGDVQVFDVNFISASQKPDLDVAQDLSIEVIKENETISIEVLRKFNTSDPLGQDIAFFNGSTHLIQFASASSHIKTHTKYYLYITDTSIDKPIIAPDIDIPVDLNSLKPVILVVATVSVLGFIVLHFLRRVLQAPIRHDYTRAATLDKARPPKFMERLRELFSSET